jgi:SAM-dependent methyltransferase
MSETNSATLRAYEQRSQAYIDGTSQELAPATRAWIDTALRGLPHDARILEIGSAFGRDAAYIAASRYRVECSDAAESFVAELQSRGFAARKLNLLTDAIGGRYDLILANAVLLHFTLSEFSFVLKNLRAALVDGGRLAISLKNGDGEEWSDAKIGVPRFFHYWRAAPLRQALDAADFHDISIIEATTDRAHADWLYVIAS